MKAGDAQHPGLGVISVLQLTLLMPPSSGPGRNHVARVYYLKPPCSSRRWGFICAHFMNEETEAQRGELTFWRPLM